MTAETPIHAHPDAADSSVAAVATYEVGGIRVTAISDGLIVPPEEYLGSPEQPAAGYRQLDDGSGVRMPAGAFLVEAGTTILIDAGIGPVDLNGEMVGGYLLGRLAAAGVEPGDVELLAMTHLHPDHVGWLAGPGGEPTFANARVLAGAADWAYFVEGEPEQLGLDEETRTLLVRQRKAGEVELIEQAEVEVAPGVLRLASPGHTPGHASFRFSNGGEELILLGDAFYSPPHVENPEWACIADVDPDRTRRTRRVLLERFAGASAIAPHFPELATITLPS